MSEADVARLLIEDLSAYSGMGILGVTVCVVLLSLYIFTALGTLRIRVAEIMQLLQKARSESYFQETTGGLQPRSAPDTARQNPKPKPGKKRPVL